MRKIELLAPGGDIDSIKAAIIAGADAIYCGLDRFNARNRAENITFADLNGIIRLAHSNDCEVFLLIRPRRVSVDKGGLARLQIAVANDAVLDIAHGFVSFVLGLRGSNPSSGRVVVESARTQGSAVGVKPPRGLTGVKI